ncbi:MAG: adenylate/guanylate cyclase domain-containing protein [Candidatus Rifleibacteriota bacterium]
MNKSNNFLSLLKNDIFWAMLFFCAALFIGDYWYFSRLQNFNIEFRTILLLFILLLETLLIEDNFFIWAIITLFPNTAYVFYLSVKLGNIGHFGWLFLSQVILMLIMTIFHWRFTKSFMPETSFKKMREELKDLKENSLSRILQFSLIGCLRERKKILAQAYHALENCFKADYSMIFLADHKKNTLVPSPRFGDMKAKNIQPIMVGPEFWNKAAYDPEKGVLNVIQGRATLPSLRQLIPQASIDAVAAMPISSGNRVIGLIAVIKQKPENRRYLDPSLFVTFGYVLGSSLENCALHEFRRKMLSNAEKQSQMIRNVFGKYVSESIVNELINNKEMANLGGKKKKVSILLADLRGFTSLASVLQIEKLVHLLNSWFDKATQLILKNNGTIDKYMGDCVMVIFGAPIEKNDDVLRSVYTAFRLQETFNKFKEMIDLPPEHNLGLGVSISTGTAIVGNFGSSTRMEYTAIGETVNLAARLEKLSGPGEIVVDAITFSELPQDKFKYEVQTDVPLKGLANQTVYHLKEVLR